MNTYQFGIVAVVVIASAGTAQSQQWQNDVNYVNHITQTTNTLFVSGFAASCPDSSALPPVLLPGDTGGLAGNCGISDNTLINLNQFARQNEFIALQSQLATEMGDLDRSLARASERADQGTAIALAMAGTPELQENEHVAFSGNIGMFQGQAGGAVGVAYRLTDHVSINAGFAGSVEGGASGGRVGLRFGW